MLLNSSHYVPNESKAKERYVPFVGVFLQSTKFMTVVDPVPLAELAMPFVLCVLGK
jgi:hypothetical protein